MMAFFHWPPSVVREVSEDPEFLWLLQLSMRTLQARQRIEAIQNIQAALYPEHSKEFRADLAERAWDADDEEYSAFIVGLSRENHVTID